MQVFDLHLLSLRALSFLSCYDNVMNVFSINIQEKDTAHSEGFAASPGVVMPMPLTSLSIDEALQHLRGLSHWEAFVDELKEVRMRVDLSSMVNIGNMNSKGHDDIPSHFIDRTYVCESTYSCSMK